MSFTDEELSVLKRMCEAGDWPISGKVLRGLLTRLAAAENCAESLNDLLHHGVKFANGAVHEADPELAKERYKTWLRSKGGAGE